MMAVAAAHRRLRRRLPWMRHRGQAGGAPGQRPGRQVLQGQAGQEGRRDGGAVWDVPWRVDRGGQVQLVGGGGGHGDGQGGVGQVGHRGGGQVGQGGGEEHAGRVGGSGPRVGEMVGPMGRRGKGAWVRCLRKGMGGRGWVVLDEVGRVRRSWGGGKLGDVGRRRSGAWLSSSLASLLTTSTFGAGGWGTASTPGYLHYQGHGYLCGILTNQL